MSNPKVFEFAKEIGLTPLALMDKIREWHLPVKSHMAELEPEVLAQIQLKLKGKSEDGAKAKKTLTKKVVPKAAAPKTSPKKGLEEGPQVVKSRTGVTAAAPAAPAAQPTPVSIPSSKATVVRRKTKEIEEAHRAALAQQLGSSPQQGVLPQSGEEAPVIFSPEPALGEVGPPVATPIEIAEEKAPVMVPPAGLSGEAPSVGVSVRETQQPSPMPTPPPLARKKEVVVGTSGVASSSTPMSMGRKNIVGRMDLSRVQQPQSGGPGAPRSAGPQGTRPGGFSGPPRTGAARNLRAGFVSQPVFTDIPEFDSDGTKNKKSLDKKTKKFESAVAPSVSPKERELEEIQDFNAVEFRKREMVFQPKKKKGMLNRESMHTKITTAKASKRVVKVYGSMKVSDLSQEIGVKGAQLIKALMTNGVVASLNTDLDFDTIALIVPEFQWEAQNIEKSAEEIVDETAFGDLQAERVPRPPVVTIMGHVDHGKTSLLDAIRQTSVASGEAGGITQHIGAYSVKLESGHEITFLDTPGHEAFTAMRSRGAQATDIAVIVVAADDGMMPQTQEAVSHAKAAGVPIIVAINKMDKPGANPERIKQQLTEMELVPEEWGGTTMYVPVSALKKTGLQELLEQIHLVAEVQELKANPKRSGTGLVIESKLEKGKGPVATLLVKDGTISVGQYFVAGSQKGRVRSLMNEKGERLESVGPGYPVEVQGLQGTPNAGDRFDVTIDEVTADRAVQVRKERQALAEKSTAKPTLEQIFSKATQGNVKEMAVILKTDVHGSLEAVQGMMNKLSTSEVKVKIIHQSVGGINESDILLGQTSKALVVGFNVRPDGSALTKAKQLNVEVRTYSIVYELIDDMKRLMSGLLTPDVVEKIMGRAEIRNIFVVPKIGTIGGCFVLDGKIQRSNQIRLIRDGKIIYEGKIGSLKRFKDDAKEVAQGFECGLGIDGYNDVKVGDILEAFQKEEVARELSAPTSP